MRKPLTSIPPALWKRISSSDLARQRVREIGLVMAVLTFLEFVVFGSYFLGATIPSFDFMGAYNLEAFAWWTDGSFFDPPQWMTYMYGGYPAVSNLQNSSYYLPVGITALFGPFSLHSSAILSALHVAGGALGTYVFARRWGMSVPVALLGFVTWFFVTGFYSNASHLDIMRAYAWVPWVFLVCSVRWDWTRWWSGIAGALILWQSFLAMYPGQLVALAYTVPVWVIANQLLFRPRLRRFLVPLAIAGASAVLMSLLRFLPALLERGHYPVVAADTSEFTIASIGTFLFPHDNPLLPWLQEMRSNFLPAVALPLVASIRLRDRLVQAVVATLVAAVFFGFPNWPWHDLVAELAPGMEASRFRLNDFKLVLLFGICVLAVSALQGILDARAARQSPTFVEPARRYVRTRMGVSALLLVALLVGFALVGMRYDFDPRGAIVQWVILAAISVIVFMARFQPMPGSGKQLTAGILALAMVSGTIAVFSVPYEWRADRTATEVSYYGSTVDALIAERAENEDDRRGTQRPARITAPTEAADAETINSHYGVVFFTGESSVFGYVNLRGTESFELVKQQLLSEGQTRTDTRAFWAAAGMVIEGPADSIPTAEQTITCYVDGECGDHLLVTPVSFDSDGSFVYHVEAESTIPVMLNEAHYNGWSATLCAESTEKGCVAVPTVRGTSGQITLELPAGSWRLTLDYALPGQTVAWLMFALGALGSVGLSAVAVSSARRRAARVV